MFRSLLIANRGEIALRVMRTARRMGLCTIAVYSDADRNAPHVRAADDAVHIGGSSPKDSYLNIRSIMEAARRTGAQAVHLGYGFLSESEDFCKAVEEEKLVWVGPPSAAIRAMGDKANAKKIVAKAGVAVLPEYRTHGKIDYPVMVKAAAGGGGRGMRLVRSTAELAPALAQARSEAEHAFGDGRLLLEPAIEHARHVEVQVFGDTRGSVVHLGERDCSVQRRHQKLIEESPSPAVDPKLRAEMGAAAVAAAKTVNYAGAGTVEFLLDQGGRFWFMEMNARLQVEHAVTELVTGLDLVEWQLRVAAGEPLPLAQQEIRFSGHAIEARLCAEDPAQNFLPQSGTLMVWEPADGVRVDHALERGSRISPHYDSMMAKLVAHAASRDEARARLAAALDATVALGVTTNKSFLASVLRHEAFRSGKVTTDFLSRNEIRTEKPNDSDCEIAAALLAADHGEWTGWSNNPAHLLRAKFGDRDISLPYGQWPWHPRQNLRYALEGEVVHLARGASSFSFRNELHDPPERKGVASRDGRLAAPMNGRVVAVHARAGDTVEAGRPLVVLEAMKMEHGLDLSFPIRVTAVHVAAGAQVAPGHLLVEFELA